MIAESEKEAEYCDNDSLGFLDWVLSVAQCKEYVRKVEVGRRGFLLEARV